MTGLNTAQKKKIATYKFKITITFMRKLIGYMITWTTYGTWLQGDERRYVKNGQTLKSNPNLKKSNLLSLKQQIIKLTAQQKIIVQNAILKEAQRINHKIHGIAVCTNHVHIVAEVSSESIEQIVHRYKRMSTLYLHNAGLNGKVWSTGFDKRFCFTEKEIENRIKYVNGHKKITPSSNSPYRRI